MSSLLAIASVVVMVIFMLVGLPEMAVAFVLPWLSKLLVQRSGILLATYLYIPFYKSVTLAYMPIDLTVWLALLCMVAVVYHLVCTKRFIVSTTLVCWFGFCVAMVIATIFAIDLQHSLRVTLETVALTFIPLLLTLVISRSSILLREFLVFTFWASVVFLLAGTWALLVTDIGRLELSSNTIGAGRVAMLAILLSPAVLPRSIWKPLIMALVLALGIFVGLASGSRGPLLAGAISIFMVYVVWTKWLAFRSLLFLGIAILGLVTLFSDWVEGLVPEGSLWRIRVLVESMLGSGEMDRSSSARFTLFDQALNMWNQRPFIGMGPGSFAVFTEGHGYPHNALLQAGAELGVIGFAIVLVLVIVAVFNTYRQMHHPVARSVAILMIFAVVSAQFSNDLYDNRWMWGMVLMAGSIEAKFWQDEIQIAT